MFSQDCVLLSGLYPFSALNPDCFICITWDSPWYLVSTSGWYHHVWCILYTNDVIPGTLCVYYQDPLVLPVLLCYQWAVEGWVVSMFPVFAIAIALPGKAVSTRYFCWQNYTVNFSKLLYVSFATVWPGVSVGHPAGLLAIFWLLFMGFWHDWLKL